MNDVLPSPLLPSPGFAGQAVSPIDANEPVGSQGVSVSYSQATRFLQVKVLNSHNRTIHKPIKKVPCRTFEGAGWCGMEWDQWVMASALLRHDDAVVEFGARWGTTSCMLARLTHNSGKVVSVEPDRNAHRALLQNRATHRCNFHAVLGTVSERPLTIGPSIGCA